MNTKSRMAMVVLAVSIAGAAVTARAGGAADYWMVDDGREIDNESIVFVDQSVRLDQRPDGWINFSFYEARNGSRAKSAKSMRMTAWANCKTREYINDYRMEYDSGGHMVAEGKVSEQQRRVPTPGSAEGRVLAFVCGDIRGATQLPRGTHFITYADSLYAQGHPQVARAPAPQASPRPPSPVAAPSTAAAPAAPAQPRAAKPQAIAVAPAQSKTQKRFCDQILQLRSAASQDFRSIDLGPIKGEPAHIHAASIHLVTADDDCFINLKAGERPHYLCSWQHFYDEASNTYDDARIDAVGNMLASCLNVRPDWSENKDFMRLDSQGAQFSLDVIAGALLLSVERGQPGRPSAPTNNPAASTVPARAGETAPATRGRPEFWMVGMTEDRHTMFFVDKASILRKPGGTVEFRRERIEKSSGKVAWLKQRSEIDCNRRTSRDLEVFAYRDDETLIGAVQPAPEAAITESTVGARILAFVCQGKEDTAVKLATGESTIMFFAIEQGDEGLDRSPAEAPSKDATPANPRPATLSGPAPARPENAATQGGSKGEMRQQFCQNIVQLRSLAPQGFKSIVRGPMKGVPGSSAVSINLPGADADSCYVTPNAGKPPDYTCSWTLGAATAERQFRGLGNLLAHCLNVRPDWSLMEVGEWTLDLESAGTRFFFVGDKERGLMALMIQVAEH